ncbi:MAG: hypothetical protein IT303_05425 [Dehalococcoidia bacterium]|nr:hypothetical protein [Dehalococcoidia bacterium]
MNTRRTRGNTPVVAGSLSALAGVLLVAASIAGPGSGARAVEPEECASVTPEVTIAALADDTATANPTDTETAVPTATAEVTDSPAPTATATATEEPAPTATPSPSATPSPAATADASSTAEPTDTPGADATESATPSPTPTPPPSPTPTPTEVPTPTPMPSPGPSPEPSDTPATVAAAAADDGSPAPADSPTATASTEAAPSATPCTPAATSSETETTEESTETATPATDEDGSSTPTGTSTPTPGGTPSATLSPTPTGTSTLSPTPKPAELACQWLATATDSASPGPDPAWDERCAAPVPGDLSVQAHAGDVSGKLSVTLWTVVRNSSRDSDIVATLRRADGSELALAPAFVETRCAAPSPLPATPVATPSPALDEPALDAPALDAPAPGTPEPTDATVTPSPTAAAPTPCGDSLTLFRATFPVSYRDACGVYEAATSLAGERPAMLAFENRCFVALELDFDALSWGRIVPGQLTGITGDLAWGARDTRPTVRNAGNAPLSLGVRFEPLTQGGASGAPATLGSFRACLGLDAGGVQCVEVSADRTAWVGEETGQALCPGQAARLDLFVLPPATVPEGTYAGDISFPSRPATGATCGP